MSIPGVPVREIARLADHASSRAAEVVLPRTASSADHRRRTHGRDLQPARLRGEETRQQAERSLTQRREELPLLGYVKQRAWNLICRSIFDSIPFEFLDDPFEVSNMLSAQAGYALGTGCLKLLQGLTHLLKVRFPLRG